MAASVKFRNTPKFLSPYSEGDQKAFPRRNKELQRLYELHKRTSFMVLHGPSGAGKTSLIRCGFVDRIGIAPGAVFYLQRQGDFITAIKEILRKKELDENIHAHILNYIDAQQAITRNKALQEEYNNMILWLETGNLRFKQELQGEIPDNTSVAELLEKRDALDLDEKKVNDAKEQLTATFEALFSAFNTSPLFIFDNFEEIFIDGFREERTRFGIFCQFLLDTSAPVNSVVVIDEDYFGHLDEFIAYVPRIFYNSVRLLDPNREEAGSIVNDLLDGAPGSGKDAVVQAILSQFYLDETSVFDADSLQHMHLPYLQVYLQAYHNKFGDKLTHGNITALGDIDTALEQYLRDLNDRILKTHGHSVQDRLQEYPVVKYLKTYVSSLTGLAEKVPAGDLSNLETEIWIGDAQQDLVKISDALESEGILVKRGEYYALAHPSLAVPISNFNIREDLLKKDFETSFQIWSQAKSKRSEDSGRLSGLRRVISLGSNENLLSRGQVFSMRPYKNYILAGGTEGLAAKKEFWNKSKRNERKWRRILIGVLILLLLLAVGVAIGMRMAYLEKKKALETEEKNAQLKKAGGITSKVYEGTGEAWKNYRNDRTSAFNKIQKSRLDYDSGDPKALEETPLPSLVTDFENTFYSDYNEYPFYLKDVELLQGSGYIIKTKTRKSGDDLYIFAQTDRGLLFIYRQSLLNPLEAPKLIKSLSNIKTFDHYTVQGPEKKDLLKVLAVAPTPDKQSLMIMKAHLDDTDIVNIDTLQPCRNCNALDNRSEYISTIEHLNANTFILGMGRLIWNLYVNVGKESGAYTFDQPRILPGEIMQIRKLGSSADFIVRFGRSGLYNSRRDTVIKQSNRYSDDQKLPPDQIYTVAYDKPNNQLLLGYNSGIVYTCNLYGENGKKRDYRHGEAVKSIDVKGDTLLIGSLDKTASLWIGKDRTRNKLDKRFIGHTDALYNVSFVDDTDYMISSGEDGHLKLWDLSPTYTDLSRIARAGIKKLHYRADSAALLVAFRTRSNNDANLGKLFKFNNSLEKTGEYEQLRKGADNADHLLAFDHDKNGTLIIAGGNNNLITTADGQSDQNIRLTNITSAIHDIQIVDTTMYIATSDGILFCSNIYKPSGRYDTLVSGHRVNSLDYSVHLGVLVSGRDDSKIRFYDKSNTPVDSLTGKDGGHNDKVADVEFSKSGNYLSSGGWDNKMIVWQRKNNTWTRDGDPHMHLNDVLDVQFSGDTLLLSASVDKTVHLYKFDEREARFLRIPSLIRHTSAVTAATFAHAEEGLHVFSGDINGGLRSWNISSFATTMQDRTYNALINAQANVEASGALRWTSWVLDSGSKKAPQKIAFQHDEYNSDWPWWRSPFQKHPWGKGVFEVTVRDSTLTLKPDSSSLRFEYRLSADTSRLTMNREGSEAFIYVRE